ncbi:hypothetical protein D0866_13296 [Hortaea werneckii]|uniref:Altered inheritance of mitochondria protein 24, mitochondrial n=1 Tax=Hortaea werneckii TaxID=91943 RepID=A0A3M6ZSK0_HORWE|nr:hypothetical protein D0866_13296 [Hortaea werneckii]
MSYPQSYHQGYPPQQGYSQQPQYDQQQQQAYGGQQPQGYPPPQQHAPPETTDAGSYQNIHYTIKHRNTNSTLNLQLGPNDLIKAKPGAMIHMSPTVKLEGAIKFSMRKMFTGGQMSQASFTGPGTVALAPTLMGDIVSLQIANDGKVWNVGKDAFLACTGEVEKETKSQGFSKAMFSGEDLFIYKMMGQGLVWLTSYGAVDVIHLQEGEQHIVDNGHLVAWNCDYKIEKAASGSWSSVKSGEGLVCRFTGPGTIYMQTRNLDDFASWAAIIAQVAISGLGLDEIANTHWTVQAAFIVSLASGLLSVYYCCIIQQYFGSLVSPDDIKDWLCTPGEWHVMEEELQEQFALLRPGTETTGTKEQLQTLRDRVLARLQSDRWVTPSINSAVMLVAPVRLLNLAVASFLIKLRLENVQYAIMKIRDGTSASSQEAIQELTTKLEEIARNLGLKIPQSGGSSGAHSSSFGKFWGTDLKRSGSLHQPSPFERDAQFLDGVYPVQTPIELDKPDNTKTFHLPKPEKNTVPQQWSTEVSTQLSPVIRALESSTTTQARTIELLEQLLSSSRAEEKMIEQVVSHFASSRESEAS